MQGSFPTHPELLDWLAVEFVASRTAGASRSLHKLIVTSATYRQSSAMRQGPRREGPAEPAARPADRGCGWKPRSSATRPSAASGLLNPKIGGPGVFPPQPKEVFAFTQSNHPWAESKGAGPLPPRDVHLHLAAEPAPAADHVRRGRRADACTQRNRSNTPLQALHLANDPVFVELADGARQADRDGRPGRRRREDRVRLPRVLLARADAPPKPPACRRTSTRSARPTRRPRGPPCARVLMNLDEFITRE